MTFIRLIMPEAEGLQVTESAHEVREMIEAAYIDDDQMVTLTMAEGEDAGRTIVLRADYILSAVDEL